MNKSNAELPVGRQSRMVSVLFCVSANNNNLMRNCLSTLAYGQYIIIRLVSSEYYGYATLLLYSPKVKSIIIPVVYVLIQFCFFKFLFAITQSNHSCNVFITISFCRIIFRMKYISNS